MTNIHTFTRTSQLPVSIEKAWDFFSSPLNLKAITPAHLEFRILSEGADQKMYPGMIIRYKVKPILGIPMVWVTEITQVRDGEYFVDEQRTGPFALWKHEHFFKPIDGGVEMTDHVQYRAPLGILGDIADAIFVRKQVTHIFDHREQKIEELFGKF